MMDRFRRLLKRHPIDDQETTLIPKEKKKSISERVTSAIRKGVMKRKGYTKVPTNATRGKGRRRRKRASAVKAMSFIRSVTGSKRLRKRKRSRKMHK
jgi:hypothetical protein